MVLSQEPTTCKLQVQCPTNSATMSPTDLHVTIILAMFRITTGRSRARVWVPYGECGVWGRAPSGVQGRASCQEVRGQSPPEAECLFALSQPEDSANFSLNLYFLQNKKNLSDVWGTMASSPTWIC